MPTRSITRQITSPIARAVNAAYAIWNPRALFALGEQGVIYDPNDLSTLWQDSAGTTPVTAAGQPVGLMLDKRLGLVRGPELVVNGDFDSEITGWTASGSTLSFSVGTMRSVSGGVATGFYSSGFSVSAGSLYRCTLRLKGDSGYSGLQAVLRRTSAPAANIATAVSFAVTTGYTEVSLFLAPTLTVADACLFVRFAGAESINVDNISIRELPGAHGVQVTASAKPFLRDTPRRIDYDADDSLGITFPVSLGAACTVARSIPGVGAQILTAQIIGTTFSDNVDNCGLIIVNRALTPTETANLTRYLNQRAGV